MTVYDAALAHAWAMDEAALNVVLDIASRQHEVDAHALESYQTKHVAKTERLRRRDDVAIVDIEGPLFKRANIFQAMSGASSYEIMARDFQEALDADDISGIILNIASPGGTVEGCDELAGLVYRARGVKPITAYVSGMACSAAYWIGSAADRMVVSEASVVGSIGVVIAIDDRKEADAKAGRKTHEFVSSRAPGKRPDIESDDGKKLIQQRVDDLEDVFIGAIAKHRGVSTETVIKDFGAGGVVIGQRAVDLKMADEVGSFETAFNSLTKRGKSRRTTKPTGERSMAHETGATGDEQTFTKADVDKAVADGIAAHQTRVTAILASDEGKANPGLASHFANNTSLSAADAIASLKAAGPTVKEKTKDEHAADFLKNKEQDTGLAFSQPAGGDAAADHGWGDVVAETNKQLAR